MYTRSQFNHLVETFAYHCSEMLTTPAPHKGMMGLAGPDGTGKVVRFEIEPCQWGGGTEPDPETGKHPVNVWDQVVIVEESGYRVHAGNRCGGRNAYAAEMADLLLAAARAVESD